MESISALKRFSAKVNSMATTPPEPNQPPESVEATITAMMGSLAALTRAKPNESLPDELPRLPRNQPLRHPWQVKWLDLECTSPDIQKLADEAMAFAFAWFQRAPCRVKVIVGPVGLGKTHVSRRLTGWARAVAFERWSRTRVSGELPTVAFKTARMLSPRKCPEGAFSEHMEEMEAASMVLIDDIGTEIDDFKTGGTAERLCHILNRLEGRYLWLTTNKEPKAWPTTWDKRVEDRLLAGDVVEIDGPSFRCEQ